MSRRAGIATALGPVIALCLAACGGSDATSESVASTSPIATPTPATTGSAAPAAISSVVEATPVATVPGPTTTPTVPVAATEAVATVTDARGVEVTITSTDRIIPLDGDVAEVVFALGMGDQVVATDLSATYPPEADALPQIGYQRALTAEPILAFDPTVLLATDIAGPPEALDALERVGVPLVVMPTDPSPAGPANKIVAVADALGVHDRGVELASEVQAEIDAATTARAPLSTAPRVAVLYVRGPGTQLVLGTEYGIHWLIGAAGGENIAVDLGITDSAPITDEAILAAAPDVLLVTASGLESVGGVDGLLDSVPALAETPAGQSGSVFAYDAQLMLGNGPRTGQFLSTLITDLADPGAP